MASETDQILKAHNPDAQPKQIDPKWQLIYDRLKNFRDQLIDSNNDLNSKGREINAEAVKQEPSEIGTSEYLQDYALGMASTEQETLAEVQAAIDRIESGTYGTCEVTGEPIPMERLEAIPWARCTLEGQKQLEERGDAVKAGIGALGTSRERGVEQPGPRREEEGSL
ncbi:MAG: TraR/DksA family transcriptional regulator [Verrucomicrobiaceae bacterium]|nr:MAG: TraR/DksA family transcriptional regulator [Verrucomicrobiaceae bacterium]